MTDRSRHCGTFTCDHRPASACKRAIRADEPRVERPRACHHHRSSAGESLGHVANGDEPVLDLEPGDNVQHPVCDHRHHQRQSGAGRQCERIRRHSDHRGRPAGTDRSSRQHEHRLLPATPEQRLPFHLRQPERDDLRLDRRPDLDDPGDDARRAIYRTCHQHGRHPPLRRRQRGRADRRLRQHVRSARPPRIVHGPHPSRRVHSCSTCRTSPAGSTSPTRRSGLPRNGRLPRGRIRQRLRRERSLSAKAHQRQPARRALGSRARASRLRRVRWRPAGRQLQLREQHDQRVRPGHAALFQGSIPIDVGAGNTPAGCGG